MSRREERWGANSLAGVLLCALWAAVCGGLSCAREQVQLTSEDCAAVGARLASAWEADATSAELAAAENRLGDFVRDEGARIEKAWLDECGELVGHKIARGELDCLKSADTIDDVYECAPIKGTR